MRELILGVLAVGAILAFRFFRRERDKFLNYRAGRVFRTWVRQELAPVMADDAATPAARHVAGAILAAAYDRQQLYAIAYGPIMPNSATPSWEAFGRHADLLRSALHYVATLALLEKRGTGTALRHFLMEDESGPLGAAARLPFEDAPAPQAPARPALNLESVAALFDLPKFRRIEQACEQVLVRG